MDQNLNFSEFTPKFNIICKNQDTTITALGHNSFKKLVCINPGSRHPTVLVGAPTHMHQQVELWTNGKELKNRFWVIFERYWKAKWTIRQLFCKCVNSQIVFNKTKFKVKNFTHHTCCYDRKSVSQLGKALGFLLLDPTQQKLLLHWSHIHLSMSQSSEYQFKTMLSPWNSKLLNVKAVTLE